ncbi:hypothetical protein [Dictyobacter kobayashii]|uniref:Uncharacterized protein n=1 Tax=Dictyobacter kobayashii TaxID=2014872 RepID=A0A402AB07_9CHLR|nr:hypothetical protein [Dictyobacter kobayashii]GCE16288.1 hypothetical protein KDK_00880 [Dictyobacter kobayashii]
MNTILDQVNNICDEDFALQLFDSLQSIDSSAEISPYITCGGKMYYEWWIANQHGMSATIAEAVQNMFAGKLMSIL